MFDYIERASGVLLAIRKVCLGYEHVSKCKKPP